MRKQRITISDVAALAKVSMTTVSRVLNGNTLLVKEETRQKVLDAIEKLDYIPNQIARGLRTKRSRTVALVITDTENTFFSTVITNAQKFFINKDITCLICETQENAELENKLIRTLCEKQVDGVIYTPTTRYGHNALRLFRSNNIECVFLTRKLEGVDVPYVGLNTRDGFGQAMDYVIGCGHKRIAHLAGNLDTLPAQIALSVYRNKLLEAGIRVNENHILETRYRLSAGYAKMKELMQLPQDEQPTAIVACNDIVAIGAIRAINDAGKSVPEDYSITGYNNIDIADMVSPRLTTVDFDIAKASICASQMLYDIIEGNKPSVNEVILDGTLIIRDSVLKI